MVLEKFLQPLMIPVGEVFGVSSQGGQQASLMFDLGCHLSTEAQEVMLDDADDVETVGHDLGVGKPPGDHLPVGCAQIDAHNLDLVAAFEREEKGQEIALAATLNHIEDFPVLQVAEGGYQTAAPVKGMFIDADDGGSGLVTSFLSFEMSELGVDASHAGRAHGFTFSQLGGADTLVVIFEDFSSKRFSGMMAKPDARQGGNKGSLAILTQPPSQVDMKDRSLTKTLQVPDLSVVWPLAHQPASTTPGATGGFMVVTGLNLANFANSLHTVNTIAT